MTDAVDVWRDPPVESVDLYPGLSVWDDRVSGSITVARSRLPLWAFASYPTWDDVVLGWPYIEDEYGWTQDLHGWFLRDLLEARGEFARLLLVVADAERCSRRAPGDRAWWNTRRHRKRVGDQLRRCLATLEDGGG